MTETKKATTKKKATPKTPKVTKPVDTSNIHESIAIMSEPIAPVTEEVVINPIATKPTGVSKKELIHQLVETYGYEEANIQGLTNAGLLNLMKKEEEEAKQYEASLTVERVTQVFKDEDLIHVMSGYAGGLRYRSPRTGRVWSFRNFGQTDKLPYGELVHMRNNSPRLLNEGWLIILNEKVQEEFQLKEKYQFILTPERIEQLFQLPTGEVEHFLSHLSSNMKNVFFDKARQLHQNNQLDSYSLIQLIERQFNVSLSDNAPITDQVN